MSAAPIDVLIVGAGPTGLMLANQLMRNGVRPLIIDRHAGPATETRALGVQARTLEIYAALGIAGQAVALGRPTAGVNLWMQGRRAARIPLGDIGRDLSPFPYLLILGQDDNERLLGQRLNEQGIDVQWRHELVAFEQHDAHVSATLRRPDGSSHDIEARWVAGCDGAHSAVRELNSIAFPGAPYQHVFFVADVHASGPMVAGELNVYLWRDGFHLFFPMRGSAAGPPQGGSAPAGGRREAPGGQDAHWRIVGIVPEPLRNREDLAFDAVMPSVRDEVGGGLAISACSWFSTYRIHHRRAERFRDRRCFLLGDAAHIHSPVGAQGMNTGLQDAYNLGWKLALVAGGRAGAALLDSYAGEREPVAERLLDTTDRAFSAVVSDRGLARFVRTRVLARVAATAMRFEPVRRFVFRTISQIGIEYRDSALSQTLPGLPAGAPRAGDRFPWWPGGAYPALDDRCFNLVVVGQPAPPVGDAALRVHRIEADPASRRVGIAGPAFWLLRPDGHVGLCGTAFDPAALTRYLAERMHLHRPS